MTSNSLSSILDIHAKILYEKLNSYIWLKKKNSMKKIQTSESEVPKEIYWRHRFFLLLLDCENQRESNISVNFKRYLPTHKLRCYYYTPPLNLSNGTLDPHLTRKLKIWCWRSSIFNVKFQNKKCDMLKAVNQNFRDRGCGREKQC